MLGSGIKESDYSHTELLIAAGRDFTKQKNTEGNTVGVQEFYDDIINKFTVFLMENEEYQLIIDTLYVDVKVDDKKQEEE